MLQNNITTSKKQNSNKNRTGNERNVLGTTNGMNPILYAIRYKVTHSDMKRNNGKKWIIVQSDTLRECNAFTLFANGQIYNTPFYNKQNSSCYEYWPHCHLPTYNNQSRVAICINVLRAIKCISVVYNNVFKIHQIYINLWNWFHSYVTVFSIWWIYGGNPWRIWNKFIYSVVLACLLSSHESAVVAALAFAEYFILWLF